MNKKIIPVEEVEDRLRIIHGETIKIVRESYTGTSRKAIFIDC